MIPLCFACAHRNSEIRVTVDELFAIVKKDAALSGAIPVDAFYATGYLNMILPESLQKLYSVRQKAIPALEKLSVAEKANERSLAVACLKVLRSGNIETSPVKTNSGVILMRFKVPALDK